MAAVNMIKYFLIVFGFISILSGFSSILSSMSLGCALIVGGFSLMGFGEIIDLLQKIYIELKNQATVTQSAAINSTQPRLSTESSEASSGIDLSEWGIRRHISRYKPGQSKDYIYETKIDGTIKSFKSDAEAAAFVERCLRAGHPREGKASTT
ncbi:hypothetical protein [Methylobacterium dankookense]|uniref:hypothetical protein n=1 Tax=Methylobacterium dankookense TaxID=560405 RepID=UPI00119EC9AE|nr:hypothetical protein [Methylobacterium dankookense]